MKECRSHHARRECLGSLGERKKNIFDRGKSECRGDHDMHAGSWAAQEHAAVESTPDGEEFCTFLGRRNHNECHDDFECDW